MLSCSEANLNVMGACGMNNVKFQYNSAAYSLDFCSCMPVYAYLLLHIHFRVPHSLVPILYFYLSVFLLAKLSLGTYY